jgi:hypothetical protein
MEQAIKFIELTNAFVNTLIKDYHSVQRLEGRRFDRIAVNDSVLFFIDRNSWEIFGAKSSFQYNPRRVYGTLDSVDQYDWSTPIPTPIAGTSAERIHNEREAEIQKNYKPRGRPRKNPVTVGA